MTSAFGILQVLIGSYKYNSDSSRNSSYSEAAIISSWGWSLCVDSFMGDDPSHMCPTVHLIKGVPARSRERKSLVIDHASRGFHIRPTSGQEECRILSNGNHDSAISLSLVHILCLKRKST